MSQSPTVLSRGSKSIRIAPDSTLLAGDAIYEDSRRTYRSVAEVAAYREYNCIREGLLVEFFVAISPATGYDQQLLTADEPNQHF